MLGILGAEFRGILEGTFPWSAGKCLFPGGITANSWKSCDVELCKQVNLTALGGVRKSVR